MYIREGTLSPIYKLTMRVSCLMSDELVRRGPIEHIGPAEALPYWADVLNRPLRRVFVQPQAENALPIKRRKTNV